MGSIQPEPRTPRWLIEQMELQLEELEASAAEAENMKLRSSLMMALDQHVRAKGWTQAETARRLGVTQPRVSDLLRGKINLFSVDSLVNMVVAAGLQIEVRVREAA